MSVMASKSRTMCLSPSGSAPATALRIAVSNASELAKNRSRKANYDHSQVARNVPGLLGSSDSFGRSLSARRSIAGVEARSARFNSESTNAVMIIPIIGPRSRQPRKHAAPTKNSNLLVRQILANARMPIRGDCNRNDGADGWGSAFRDAARRTENHQQQCAYRRDDRWQLRAGPDVVEGGRSRSSTN